MNKCILLVLTAIGALVSLDYTTTPLLAASMQSFRDDQLVFTHNKGQLCDTDGHPRPDLLFVADRPAMRLYLRATGFSYVFRRVEYLDAADQNIESVPASDRYHRARPIRETLYRMDMELLHTNPDAVVEAVNPRTGHSNYYLAHCPQGITDVRSYGWICYRDIYPGVDLHVRGSSFGLKYDFVIKPGGRPEHIRMRYPAASMLELSGGGELRIENPLGQVVEQAPFSYLSSGAQDEHTLQRTSDEQTPRSLDVRWRIRNDVVSFALPDYDRTQTLVIDPDVVWATYYGGQGEDRATNVAVDRNNNLLITGRTENQSFPTSPGAFQISRSDNNWDAFLLKFDALRERLWATVIGADSADEGSGVTVTPTGIVALTGTTKSRKFPVSASAFQSTIGAASDTDAFLAAFNVNGQRIWATYFGGSDEDRGIDIDVGPDGLYAVVGMTKAKGSDFPTEKALQSANKNESRSTFVAKFTGSGQPFWSTFYGGSAQDLPEALAVDRQGFVLVSGTTLSDDFPVTHDALLKVRQGNSDAFVVRFKPTGDTAWASYFGGSGDDLGLAVAVDSSGNFLIGGSSESEDLTLKSAFQPALSSTGLVFPPADGFLAKFRANGSLDWSTYYGGRDHDLITSLAFYPDDSFAAVGYVVDLVRDITTGNVFHISDDAYAADRPGLNSCVMMKFEADGQPYYSSYYGSSLIDRALGLGLEVDDGRDGNLIFVGYTEGDDTPLVEAFQTSKRGLRDALIVEFGCDLDPAIEVLGEAEFCAGDDVTLRVIEESEFYEWSTGETTREIVVAKSGAYSVRVSDAAGCAAESKPVDITVHPRPVANISAEPSLNLCPGDVALLDAGEGFLRYEWGDGSSSQTISVDAGGEYNLTVWNEFGCSSSASVQVTARTIPNIAIEPAALDFGALDACSALADDVIRLRNPLPDDVEITAVSFDGDAVFSLIEPALPQTLDGNGSLELRLRYNPQAEGSASGTLRIQFGPCPFEIAVDLRGRKLSLALSAAPVSIDLGRRQICAAPVDTFVVLRNTGSDDVELRGIRVDAPFQFLGSDGSGPLAPDQERRINLRYLPDSEGMAARELILPYRAGPDCIDTIRIALRAEGIDPELRAADLSLDFGVLTDCETSSSGTLLLSNESDLRVTINEAVIGQHFQQGETLPLLIAPGAERSIEIIYLPVESGTAETDVRLRYTIGECEKELLVRLTGRQDASGFEAPGSVDFGRVLLCGSGSSSQTISLLFDSDGQEEARINDLTITGPFSTPLQAGALLQPGEARPIELSFTPVQRGPAQGLLTLVLEPCNVRLEIELSAIGAAIALNGPTAVDFGLVNEGGSADRELLYRNDGEAAMTVESLGCISDPFELLAADPPLPASLNPGETLRLTLRFHAGGTSTQATLCLQGMEPCDFSTSSVLRGQSINSSRPIVVAIPILSADVRDRDFHIPVLLLEGAGLAGQLLDRFEIELRFNASLFFPKRVEAGTLLENRLDGGERVLRIAADNLTLPEEGGALLELVGDVLLGDAIASDILITDLSLTSPDIVVRERIDGQLNLEGICEAGGHRLLSGGSAFGILHISPQPAQRHITVELFDVAGAASSLRIYSLQGACLFNTSWQSPGSAARRFDIDADLPPGHYQLVLTSSIWRDTAQLLIVK